MADSKISALTALAATPASGDLFVAVDVSDTTMAASGTNKKVTFAEMTGGFLLATGATTGATSQAQTFASGIIGPSWQPVSNSTTALRMQNAGGTAILTIDTTNSNVIVNPGGTSEKGLIIGNAAMPSLTTLYLRNEYPTIRQRVARAAGGFAFSMFALSAENTTGGLTTDLADIGCLGSVQTSPTAPTLTYVYLSSLPSPAYNNANFFMLPAGYIGLGTGNSTPTAWADFKAASTAEASLRVRAGSAPTAPNAGDAWNDGALSFYNADSTTNAVVNHLRLRRNSTGTAASGFGLGIIAELESSTTDAQSAGRLTWAWSTATHASRAAIGKLTAFYTSTEREAITWAANSTGVVVGIGTNAPQTALHVDGTDLPFDAPGGLGIFQDDSDRQVAIGGLGMFRRDGDIDDGASLRFNYIGYNGGTTRFRDTVIYNGKATQTALFDGSTGYLGLGNVAPVGLLHGHDGSGGFLFVNRTGVSSTLVTVIPDGTGDVTERLHMFGWVSNSSGGFVSQVNEVYLDVSSSTTKTDGSNTLTIAVTAAGAFTLQTTLGTATWKVLLWVFWR